MIRIDLLPPEYRRAERTAPAVFLATAGLVAFACVALFGVGYVWFGVVGKARGETEMAQDHLDNIKPRAEYSDRLESEKKDFSARLLQIKEFSDSRVLWTKKLDVLASLVDSPPEALPHTAWFGSLQMEMSTGRKMGLTLKGSSETGEIRRVSNLHATLKDTPVFFDGFVGISNPAGKVVVDEEYEPKESCEFEFLLELKDVTAAADPKKKKAAASRARPTAQK